MTFEIEMDKHGKGRNLAFFKIQNDVYRLRSGFYSVFFPHFDVKDLL